MTMNERDIFDAALAIDDPAQRAAYLDRACAGNPRLREHIDGLLSVHEQVGSFLESPALAGAPTVDEPVSERPDTVIGPYKLMEQIGEGGMGLVFVAEQQHPVRRKVALKVIKPGMDTRAVIARFEAERQALALMDHPNIAKVLDGGETSSGRPYFVMELVKGAPITEYCDQEQLPIRERLELFGDVCEAVQHAHQKGIIHRDIKPSNVLVVSHDGKPVVKVIDFGVAKAIGRQLTDKTVYTHFAQLIGTPLYMSPEQAGESGLDVDTRSDIYSLGVLLYEMLTGATPFDKERFSQVGYDEMRRIIREEEPPRPSTRISTLGQASSTISARRKSDPKRLSQLCRGELDWIVMKCLEKDRTRRYETANSLAGDLQHYLADEPVQACPPSAWYRLRKFARRNKTASAVAAAMLLAVCSLAGAVKVLADSNAQIEDKQQQTSEALKREQRSVERERRTAYDRTIQLVDQQLSANNVGRAEELLDECPVSLRGWEWHYLKRRQYREPVTFRGHRDWVFCVAISPDGTLAASGSAVSLQHGDLKVWDVATGKVICSLVGHSGPIWDLAFSPDGKSLASSSLDRTVRLWDVSTWQTRHVLRGHTDYTAGVAFSPDSRLLASGSGDRTLKVWDAATGQEVGTLRGHSGGLFGVAFSPDGRHLASASSDETIRVWDVVSGKAVQILRGHAGYVFRVAYSRDGAQLASAGFDGAVRVWDATTGRQVRTIRADSCFAMSVAFSPDATRLAVASWDRNVKLWDLATGQEVLALRGHTDLVNAVAFSKDGRLLASASYDGTVKVWDATPWNGAGGGESLIFRGHEDLVVAVLFSPDGRRLASAGCDGAVKLWDLRTGEEVLSLPGEAGPALYLGFSRDGRRLASSGFHVVKLWDVTTGKELARFGGTLGNMTLRPDGRRVAWSLEGGVVEVRDVDAGGEVLRFQTHLYPVNSVIYSPDGQRLVTASWDKTAKVWDATNGAELLTLRGHDHVVQHCIFSQDGQRLATSSWDRTAKVWDAATGKELFTLGGHTGRVDCVAFSPDGKYLATASNDQTVKIWDMNTGKELRTLAAHSGHIGAVAFSPDGRRLATAGGHRGKGEIKIWDAPLWERKADQ
jgi:WD40 repeat protein/serine/threonine protein kinase